jgi:hypothetical protein
VLRNGSAVYLQRSANEAKWVCDAVLGKGNFATVYKARPVQSG